jgi:uncharacterized membrane protein YqaE (UPF0057 family)
MDMTSTNRTVNAVFHSVLFVVLCISFQINFLSIAPEKFFNNFQLNGQARVIGGIIADKHGIDKKGGVLGKVYTKPGEFEEYNEAYTIKETYQIFQEFPAGEPVYIDTYTAQYGLQGIVYSYLHRNLGLSELSHLQSLVSVITSFTLVLLFAIYRKIYGNIFSVLFLVALAASPWLVAMGRNLYWSPFLLFLPAVAAALLSLEKRKVVQYALLILIAFFVFIKSLSNYEYVSSVIVLACSVFIVGPFFQKNEQSPKPDYKMAFIALTACVIGFSAAILVHADSRGDTLVLGLQDMYEEDIQRRTYGKSENYDHLETKQSLEASPLDVLKIYILEWPGKRQMILPGKLFWALLFVSAIGIFYKLVTRHPTGWRDLVTFVTFFAVPASWFILAKGHSYTQTHINFVLWYIGFIPALIYVGCSSMMVLYERLSQELKEKQHKKYM